MKVREFENMECTKEKEIIIDFATGAKVYKKFKLLPKKYLEAEALRYGTYGSNRYCFIIAEA